MKFLSKLKLNRSWKKPRHLVQLHQQNLEEVHFTNLGHPKMDGLNIMMNETTNRSVQKSHRCTFRFNFQIGNRYVK